MLDVSEHSHRRKNILTGEWILVSPHRAKRPWQGQEEEPATDVRPQYDESCYLCPGNTRKSGVTNPDYQSTYVFDNDFMALQPDVPQEAVEEDDLFVARGEAGICRVVCFSPRHDLTLPEMERSAIRSVVDLWVEQYEELGSKDFIRYVQLFENKGQVMGCSNPHPHGQIWAQSNLPPFIEAKNSHMKAYHEKHGRSILEDYLKKELEKKERIVYSNAHFVVLVPYWAVWPYETYIAPIKQKRNIAELNEEERDAYADALKVLTTKYDNLFSTSFPYSAGIHQAPTDGQNYDYWHFHHLFFPPLLRSATVKKFMVGYEMLGMPQRDITAEYAAGVLKDLSDVHFKAK